MRWLVFGCKSEFRLFLLIGFVFVFIKQKSTQDTRACVSLLPWNVCCHDTRTRAVLHRHTNQKSDRQTDRHKVQVTGSRSTQQKHTGQSISVKPFPHPPPPSVSASAFSFSSALCLLIVSKSHIFINFHSHSCALLLLSQAAISHTSSYLSQLLCSSHVVSLRSPLLLSVCLTAVVGFCIALFLFSEVFLFLFLFEGSIYLYK